MFVSKLPPKPNFDVLAAAAPASADRRTSVLALICSWSNNESLFIYVLMILLRTFHATAAGTTDGFVAVARCMVKLGRMAEINAALLAALEPASAPSVRSWRKAPAARAPMATEDNTISI